MNYARAHPLRLLLISGAALRFCIAWAPLEWLMRFVLSDDAFYYFTIARNVASGFGFSFDRIAETNGFHPLWLIVNIPFHALIADKILALRAILSLAAVIDVVTIFLLWILLHEQSVRPSVRMVLCSLYAYSPMLFSHVGPMSGLETPLNLMILSYYVILYRRILHESSHRSAIVIVFGIVSGLLLLVRTDNAILLIVTYVHIAFQRDRWRSAQHLAIPIAIVSILLAPWILWSWKSFGSFMQVSGLSIAYVTRANVAAQGWTAIDYVFQSLRNLAGIAAFFPLYIYNAPSAIRAALLSAGFILVLLITRTTLYRSRLIALIPLMLAVILLVTIHTVRGVYLRGWYYTSLYPILVLAFADFFELCVAALYTSQPHTLRRTALIGLSSLLLVYAIAIHRVFTKSPGEADKFHVVAELNKILPENTTIGSWNAGVYGYFFQRGNVVNLDGLVNNAAYGNIGSRSLGNYCHEVGVTHLVDQPGSFRWWQPFWDRGFTAMMSEGRVVYTWISGNGDTTVVLELHTKKAIPATLSVARAYRTQPHAYLSNTME